jgi:hypothetical protein
LAGKETTVHIGIRWQTEALSELDIPRRKRACDLKRTDPAVVNRIRELAPRHPDSQVAELLDQENLTPGASDSFTESKVQWIRYAYDIPTGCPVRPSACPNGQRGDGRYSAQAAAELLNVNISTIAAWCKSGRLDGIQAMPRSPWWVKLTPDIIAGLRKPVRRRWSLRSTA